MRNSIIHENSYSQEGATVVKRKRGRNKTRAAPERLDRCAVGRDSLTVYGNAKLHMEQTGINKCSGVFEGFRV